MQKTHSPTCPRPRLLLIDDDLLVRRALARILSPSFDVVVAASAEAAFEILEMEAGFAVVLCDVLLGGAMSGQGFYERALARNSALADRIVLMSGLERSDDAFGRAIAKRWLMKPFTTTELVALLERLRCVDVAA